MVALPQPRAFFCAGPTRVDPLQLQLQLQLQLEYGERVAFGPGKADLLDAIGSQGSISAAARAMGMSYRRAWLLVDECNRCFRVALVETPSGGGRERGARLTDEGRAALASVYGRI